MAMVCVFVNDEKEARGQEEEDQELKSPPSPGSPNFSLYLVICVVVLCLRPSFPRGIWHIYVPWPQSLS